MTRIVIALLAAAVFAVATFKAPPASAGVRIGFGIPLGAFMATPSHGPSYNRGTRRSKAASGAYRQKKAYAASRATERAKIARAQRERAMARAEARAAARAAAARAEAKADAKADAKANVAKADDKADDKTEKKTNEAATSTSTGVSEPKPLAPAPATPPSGPVTTTVEPAVVQTTATMSVPDTPVETKADPEPTTTTKKADCKKFVPSVGLTITVPCN